VELQSKTPVEFLRLILPRLEPMRENDKILSDPARSDRDHSVAALKILQDLCASFETFLMLDLPDVLGSDRDIVCDQVDDTAWLVSVGRSLDRAMLSEGLVWPPPNQNPPSIVRDLSTMYLNAIKHRSTYPVLSSGALLNAIQPVGTLACRFSLKWPRDRIAEPPLLKSGTEYAKRSSRLVKSLGIVANLAQALTLPAGLFALGTDMMHLTQHIGTAMQVVDVMFSASEWKFHDSSILARAAFPNFDLLGRLMTPKDPLWR
jgi:hypothetical protein